MNITEIQSSGELRAHEFPVVASKSFLAHAGVCPLPRRVAHAISQCAQEGTLGDQETTMHHRLAEARRLAARLLSCQEREVSLVGPTSLALSYIASGLNFRKGDNILIYQDDYPSNVYPWMALAAKGVQVRFLNTRELGMIRPKDVMGQVDENTRLVALASCHFISGYRINHSAIGKYLRERGILFCLDGIQTVGAWPTTVEHVDFLAADAHKWMLGPCGAGILYVRDAVRDRLNPPIHGWHNVLSPHFVAQEEIQFHPDGRKFEVGTHNLLGVTGLIAAMELILEMGVDNIAGDLAAKRTWLAEACQAKGYEVLNPRPDKDNISGIVSIHRSHMDIGQLHRQLAENGVVASLRQDRLERQFLRFSPHFYCSEADLQKAVAVL